MIDDNKKYIEFKSEMENLILNTSFYEKMAIQKEYFIDEQFLIDMVHRLEIFKDMYIQNNTQIDHQKEYFIKNEESIKKYKTMIKDFFSPPITKEKTLFD